MIDMSNHFDASEEHLDEVGVVQQSASCAVTPSPPFERCYLGLRVDEPITSTPDINYLGFREENLRNNFREKLSVYEWTA